ncbi:putative disease resistance protein At3g14460 [Vitis riparia]|uniref:putative disease resistance protein At3g14460 n=1 Tax=Vitis riparia TaxID=96939 RepID=UPI00155A940A|nr:putative disease resistance protein At3g14460 [Vitis riparia]XP_034703141.1 putative disease resistance protein At3g14460 [Vitis riparia]XP_034703142.1 putative disease resistance protein At3g14460 [Vitis riparia]XP_034703143.1 putative disease resistance protein At3g14460 [Vitis riparia]XP_034703144.1 putative disease resistance protein At3g14460 [Vitis riparia]
MFVGEVFLSSLFEVVLDKLVATPLLEYARLQKVESTLEDWRKTLLHLQAVMNDAEQKQVNDTAVRMWLDDLKALAYDIEDVLDEFDTEASRRSLVEGSAQTSASKVRKLIPTFRFSGVRLNDKIGKKMKRITQELDAVVKRKSDLHLTEGVGGVSTELTTCLVDELEVYGRDADKEKIMELLLSDEVHDAGRKVRVIPIVGMGGVGKTTLAQIIYNDKRVDDNFDIRVWVCVSDQFDLVGITRAILESVSGHSSDSKNLPLLQDRLQKELNGKRFFLVLDDMWNQEPIRWSSLEKALRAGAQGSVVMVTTRHEDVASIMRTTPSHHLSELSDEHCWSVFADLAFENITPDARQNLEPIGRQIFKKCKGLPLAAKTLGGLLRSKHDENAWKNMLNSEIWDLPAEQSSILPVLHLSYHYLPSTLKQCFAYCSIFPKDHEFLKEGLILLWVAQGLVGGLKAGETMEEVGEACFHNLLSRSFFQQSARNKSLFVMHDLIHDLAQFISEKDCFRLEVGKQNHISKRARHLSYIREEFDVSKKFDPLYETNNLRTFLPLDMPLDVSTCYLAEKVLHNLLPTLRCLRVLSLSHYNISHLPDSFGNLKHLRYLNLSYTGIKKLPKSIGKLLNLQSLILSNCGSLIELPPEIGELVNLRHFLISRTSIEGLPTGINRLKDLRRLSTFVVVKHGGARISELRDLSWLGGALSILNLQNIVNATDALEANLKDKKDIEKLVFSWDPSAIVGDSDNQTRVLEWLQPHNKLKGLTIGYYCGEKFPNWLGDSSFMNLVSLEIKNCKSCSSLPSLGQLKSLKCLRIVKMDGVRKVGMEFCRNGSGSSFKPFGSLVTLVFQEMLEWEEWDCSGVEFPCLKELDIIECPKLKGDIPKHLPHLRKLEITKCGQLPSIDQLWLNKFDFVMPCKVPMELQHLHSLVELCLVDCPYLIELPPVLHKLISLKLLVIKKCPSLSSVLGMGLPSMLEILKIKKCERLESLPEGMMQNNNRLRGLIMKGCSSLRSFPRVSSLEYLQIRNCGKVELSLPQEIMMHNSYPSLTSLDIKNSCDSLTHFPLGSFTKLEDILFRKYANLEAFYIPDGLHHVDLTSLQNISIWDCPNLVSFPQGGLPAPNLRVLWIGNCKKLKSLPQQMHTLITSLQDLRIVYCPEIDSFPQGGLPTSLSLLCILGCYKLMQRWMEWGLQTLPSLRKLEIEDSDEGKLESFPEKWLLPSTLSFVGIYGFPNLKSLDNMGLHDLNSLETLEIQGCTMLKSFPKQGLPSSLSCLKIINCPLLKKRCQRDKGKEWPKIFHIPSIVLEEDESSKEVILS